MAFRFNPITGDFDLVDSTGGGSGTVTSVAGGVGITNVPEPIVGAGTVNLDIDSLAAESSLAPGDLFPFVDVSVVGPITNQRKVTFADLTAGLNPVLDHGALLGLGDDDHAIYLLLAGRTGTTNDPIISLDTDGTIYGSADSSKGLLLASSTSVSPPEMALTPGFFGGDSLTLGDPVPRGFFPFVAAYDINVVGTSATFGGITLNGGMGAATLIFGAASNGSFGAFTTSGDFDALLNISAVGCDADNNFAFSPSAAALEFHADGPPGSGYVPGQLVIINTGRTGESHNRLWIRHNGQVSLGDDVGYPEGRLHVLNVDPVVPVLVVQGATWTGPQTANLTDWEGSVTGLTTSGAGDNLTGSTTLKLVSSTAFAASGVIYLFRADASIGSDLPMAYTANNTGTGEITLVDPLPLDFAGKLVYQTVMLTSIDADGKVSLYTGLTTAGMGVAPILDVQALTAQVADIADTAFVNGDVAGLYRVHVYLLTTTADGAAGDVTVHIKYTDDGAAQDVTAGPVLLTTLGAFAEATIFVQLASGSITYGTTSTGIYGTSAYALYATCERIS